MVLKNPEKEKKPFKVDRKPAENGLKSLYATLKNGQGIGMGIVVLGYCSRDGDNKPTK